MGILSFCSLINSLINVAKECVQKKPEPSTKPEPKSDTIDPWQAMLFAQAGPSRTFPRLNPARQARLTAIHRESPATRARDRHPQENHDIPLTQ